MRRQMYPIDQRVELRDETLEPVKEEKRFKRGVSDEFAGEVRNSCMQLCPGGREEVLQHLLCRGNACH